MTIDIMLPFYGRSDHFKLAVESVRAQSDPDWRLVIIDDANPDPEPGAWAAGLADPRIECHRHETNLGINASFQESLERSRATWVTVFGCDDVMRPGYVGRIAELTRRFPDAGFIHPGAGVIDGDGRPARSLVDTAKAWYRPRGPRPLALEGEALATNLLRGNWMNFPAIAWHGPTVRRIGFAPGYQVVQDLRLALDVCRAGRGLVLDDEVVFDYRRHRSSVSSWRAVDGSRFVEERAFFTSAAEEFDAAGWHRAARAARRHLSSRINALTQLPAAARMRDATGAGLLLRHATRR